LSIVEIKTDYNGSSFGLNLSLRGAKSKRAKSFKVQKFDTV